MKNIIYTLFFLSVFTHAQDKQIISIGADYKLGTSGAYSYDKTKVLDAYFSIVTQREDNKEFGVFVEYANLNPKFFAMGLSGGYNFNLVRRFDTVLNLEGGLIVREFDGYETQKAYLFMGANGIIRYWFLDWVSLDARLNVKYRNDLAKYYNDPKPIRISGILGLSFKF